VTNCGFVKVTILQLKFLNEHYEDANCEQTLSPENGRLEGWKVGRLEGWKVGRLEGWKVGRILSERELTAA
jgi:hypothetical protein